MNEAKATIPGIEFVKKLEGIEEYRLKNNGLRILLIPDDSVPVAGVMVTYHVGSRNEATGYTGATHLLEHLMFKGSEKFNKKSGTAIDATLEANGAVMNATTWMDRTNYYEVVPKDVVPLAMEIEADRMRTAEFTEEDRASEMPIVRNEFEMGENNPIEALDKAIWAAAFQAHPYHHSTIGWRSDIEGVSIERLKQFYDDFYWPDNATLVIAGNIDTEVVLKNAKKFFGVHSKKVGPYPALYTTEPAQEGQRRVTVSRSGYPIIGIGHKIPEATHSDIPALLMLSNILYDDKSSVLYKTFIETALATDVTVMVSQFHDPSLFQTYISLTPKMSHQKAEDLLLKEYQKIIDQGVTATQLKAAKRSARVGLSHRTDGPFAVLAGINEDLAVGDWTRFVTIGNAIEAVTAKDVQRVAKLYLKNDQSTVGWFIPNA